MDLDEKNQMFRCLKFNADPNKHLDLVNCGFIRGLLGLGGVIHSTQCPLVVYVLSFFSTYSS